MKAANIVWDAATLDAYLLDPQKLVPQNKMPFPGLKTANERKDVIAYLVAATSPAGAPAVAQRAQPAAAAPAQPSAPATSALSSIVPDARYTLRSGIAEGRMVYLGVGGTIDGQVNPVLSAAEGQTVQIILINGEGAEHDIVFPDQNAKSPRICRPRREHDHRLPRHARRRFHLSLQRSRPRTGRHARTIHRHAAAARSGPGRSRHLAESDRGAAADRQPSAADGAGRSQCGRARRPARGRHHVRLLDLQRPRARTDAARSRRRHGGRARQELRRQHDDSLGRLPRRHRARAAAPPPRRSIRARRNRSSSRR